MIPAGSRVHFVGIGGAGMSAIASVLLARGYVVSGSDLRESEVTRRLRAAGARIQIGHAPEHIEAAQVVVISRAVPEANVEVQMARTRGVLVLHRAEMLAILMEGTRSIAVVGTHGKTTTTSMIARIFEQAGRDPTVLIGGEVDDFGGNARAGRGEEVVAEVDESDGSLLKVAPQIAVVTAIDATDHLDFYGSMDQVLETFRLFLQRLPARGFAVVCTDAIAGRGLAQTMRGAGGARALTYGLEPSADYSARILEMAGSRTVFEARRGDHALGRVILAVPGAYNAQNALGALAASLELGVPFASAAAALETFRGVQRRFTVRGDVAGVLVVDDYAHNPTKVHALLQAARQCWPDSRIIAVFQPHRYSRTKTVGPQFAGAFDPADEVVITELFAADEAPVPGVDAGIIVRAVGARRRVHAIADAAEVTVWLEERVRPGDLVLTIGAGDVWKIGDALVSRLRARAAGVTGRG
jgi:UDP-N-acetylmuramate--alanine ligase